MKSSQLSLFIGLTCVSLNLFSLSQTDIRLFEAFDNAQHQAPFHITKTQPGSCDTHSKTNARPDAWACSSGKKHYDPCFIKTYNERNIAICPSSPWLGNSIQLTLKSPKPIEARKTLDLSQSLPWAVELSNGTLCQQVGTLATNPYYTCNDQSKLLPRFQRCKKFWQTVQQSTSGMLVNQSVKRAWF